MKPTILFIALLLSMTFSCKKQATGVLTPTLPGKWRLVLITGGLANVRLTAAQWGHSKSYIFGEKTQCTVIMDNVNTTTTYATKVDKSYTTGGQGKFLIIGTGETYEYGFKGDTLQLAQDVRVDGMTEWYVKEY